MKRLLFILIALLLAMQAYASSANIPDFSGFTRRYLVALSASDVKFIFSENKDGAEPNYNWSLPYGYSPICTMAEIQKIREAVGAENFSKYGELLNYGWLYDQRQFDVSLKKFQELLKKDKSRDARIIEHVVEKDLHHDNVERQKELIEKEIERNENRLVERSGLSRTKAAELVKSLSRRFKSCLGRYQTGFVSLAVQTN